MLYDLGIFCEKILIEATVDVASSVTVSELGQGGLSCPGGRGTSQADLSSAQTQGNKVSG